MNIQNDTFPSETKAKVKYDTLDPNTPALRLWCTVPIVPPLFRWRPIGARKAKVETTGCPSNFCVLCVFQIQHNLEDGENMRKSMTMRLWTSSRKKNLLHVDYSRCSKASWTSQSVSGFGKWPHLLSCQGPLSPVWRKDLDWCLLSWARKTHRKRQRKIWCLTTRCYKIHQNTRRSCTWRGRHQHVKTRFSENFTISSTSWPHTGGCPSWCCFAASMGGVNSFTRYRQLRIVACKKNCIHQGSPRFTNVHHKMWKHDFIFCFYFEQHL